tara:strand:- start:4387 stop:5502 length:1116 start_codon:yes stop_codon:yes gene_type:complete
MRLSSLIKDKKIANGLPSVAYTDEKFLALESDTVFAKNWAFVGFVHELVKPGDVLPIELAGKPLLLVKNIKGEIVAFHNVCRHRCLKLVDQPKNTGKLIRCPYHSWTYDLDGNLIASPHFGGTGKHKPNGFEPRKHGLVSVRIKVWHDWIFVNLNKKAPPFEKYVKKFSRQLNDIDLEKIKPVATLDFGEISTNWKFLVENYIEPYHVQFVHPKTTSQPLKDHYTIVDGNCFGSGVDLNEENTSSGNLSVSSRYLSLFPNFIIGTYYPNQIGVYLNLPVDCGRTIQKRIIYAANGYKITTKEANSLKKLWWDVHKEDHDICERLQLGRASPVSAKGGILSPHWEKSVRAFHKHVIKSVMKSPKRKKNRANA